jgi:hypothetical protein
MSGVVVPVRYPLTEHSGRTLSEAVQFAADVKTYYEDLASRLSERENAEMPEDWMYM